MVGAPGEPSAQMVPLVPPDDHVYQDICHFLRLLFTFTFVCEMSKKKDEQGLNDKVDNHYEVEKILKKKFVPFTEAEGEYMPHYYIKWKGYANYQNTWEPLNNLDACALLLHRFERKNYARFAKNPNDPSNIYVNVHEPEKDKGKPKVAEKLLGGYQIPGTEDRFYLIKWKDREEPSLLPASQVKEQFPDLLMDFYENNVECGTTEGLNIISEAQYKKESLGKKNVQMVDKSSQTPKYDNYSCSFHSINKFQ